MADRRNLPRSLAWQKKKRWGRRRRTRVTRAWKWKTNLGENDTAWLKFPAGFWICPSEGDKGAEEKAARLSLQIGPVVICAPNAAAAIGSVGKGGLARSPLWLISRAARGPVRSHSLVGARRVRTYLPPVTVGVTRRRWPLDPRLTGEKSASAMVFPLGEAARERRRRTDTWKMRK